MCEDLEPDDVPEDGEDDGNASGDDPDLEALARELFGPDPLFDPATDGDEDCPPTPGERVLYALGQLHRLHLAGRLPVHPSAFSIEDIARIVGVSGELEFTSEDRHGQHFHFPSQVLFVNPAKPFPWRLLSVWEWAAEQEANSFWAEGWD